MIVGTRRGVVGLTPASTRRQSTGHPLIAAPRPGSYQLVGFDGV
jgi:hypothetical protein